MHNIDTFTSTSIPIMSYDQWRKKEYFVVATGFMVHLGKKYFLVTAAHVARKIFETGIGPVLPIYENDTCYTECLIDLPWKMFDSIHSENIDLAIAELDCSKGVHLRLIDMYSIIKLSPSDSATINVNDDVAICGYVANRKNKFYTTPNSRADLRATGLIASYDFESDKKINSESDNRYFPLKWSKNAQVSHLNGMSGSPVFNIKRHLKGEPVKDAEFIGMLVEYRPNNGDNIIAIKSNVIISMIYYYANGLCRVVPE